MRFRDGKVGRERLPDRALACHLVGSTLEDLPADIAHPTPKGARRVSVRLDRHLLHGAETSAHAIVAQVAGQQQVNIEPISETVEQVGLPNLAAATRVEAGRDRRDP
jgi:hypothetical protein